MIYICLSSICLAAICFILYISSPWQQSSNQIKLSFRKQYNAKDDEIIEESRTEDATQAINMCKYDTTLGNKDVNVDCAALLDDLVNGKFNVGYRQILSNKKNYLDTSKLCSSDFSGTIGSIHYNSTDYFTKLYDNIVNSSAEIKCASIPVAEIVTQDKSIYENFNVELTICKCDDLTFFKQYNGCDLSVGKTYTIPFYAEIAFDGKNYTLIQLSQGQMTTKDLEQ